MLNLITLKFTLKYLFIQSSTKIQMRGYSLKALAFTHRHEGMVFHPLTPNYFIHYFNVKPINLFQCFGGVILQPTPTQTLVCQAKKREISGPIPGDEKETFILENQELENQEIENQELETHEIENQEIENQEIENQELENTELENPENSPNVSHDNETPLNPTEHNTEKAHKHVFPIKLNSPLNKREDWDQLWGMPPKGQMGSATQQFPKTTPTESTQPKPPKTSSYLEFGYEEWMRSPSKVDPKYRCEECKILRSSYKFNFPNKTIDYLVPENRDERTLQIITDQISLAPKEQTDSEQIFGVQVLQTKNHPKICIKNSYTGLQGAIPLYKKHCGDVNKTVSINLRKEFNLCVIDFDVSNLTLLPDGSIDYPTSFKWEPLVLSLIKHTHELTGENPFPKTSPIVQQTPRGLHLIYKLPNSLNNTNISKARGPHILRCGLEAEVIIHGFIALVGGNYRTLMKYFSSIL